MQREASLARVNARVLIALFLLAVFALGAVVLVARARQDDDAAVVGSDSRFEGGQMPEGLKAPDFVLRDQNGERVSMRDLRGRPVIVTYLYTTCEDSCPLQAQTVRGALDQLGHDVPALAIAVDPPRDTPERARAFLLEQRATGRIDFVLGTRAELRPLWNGFGIQPQSVTQEHQARFTLVDARGYQRVGFPGGEATPERLAHDIRLLERES
jgi:protein SCO1